VPVVERYTEWVVEIDADPGPVRTLHRSAERALECFEAITPQNGWGARLYRRVVVEELINGK